MPRPDEAAVWLPGTLVAGKYRIERELASSERGGVHLATQLALRRPVAIKTLGLLSQDGAERLNSEAVAFGRLRHPNVVEVYDSGTTVDGGLYLVMEYLDGPTLADKIKKSAMDIPSLLQVARQVCSGIRQAHYEGLVHCDLNPTNVILTEHGLDEGPHAKVVDFGLGSIDDAKEGRSPTYLAPEQLRREAVDTRTDVYALGVILYEMLTGRPPFVSRSRQALQRMHLEAMPPPVAVTPTNGLAELEVVLQRCLSKDPDQRYQHAGEVLVDLDAIASLLELVDKSSVRGAATLDSTWGTSVRSEAVSSFAPEVEEQSLAPHSGWWSTLAMLVGGLVASCAVWWWLFRL